MPVRKIIIIDEEKCDGCALCVDACHEGAIQLVDGVAKLVSDSYCDGLGDCLGECPQGAITIEERDVAAFDEKAVATHLEKQRELKKSSLGMAPTGPESAPGLASAPAPAPAHAPGGGCPGSAMRQIKPLGQMAPTAGPGSSPGALSAGTTPSALTNWPVQLHLAPVQAPFFHQAKLLVAADCVAFSHPDFHQGMLAGRTLLIGCPKLDDTSAYLDKLTAIFQFNEIVSVEVAFMEVPCCSSLVKLIESALQASGKDLQPSLTRVSIRGEVQAL
jgi:Pyruvate/2-oxoacid:ferredoxin oxidoreductase delta subunit